MRRRDWLLLFTLCGPAPLAAQRVPLRLALVSVRVPGGVDSTGTARKLLDSLLTEFLMKEGYLLVPRDSVDPIWTQAEAAVGGVYDPVTGERSDAKADQANQAFRDSVQARFAPDAILYPRVGVMIVGFHGGKAKWDGIEEKTGARGGLGGAFLGTYQGRLRALSFMLGVRRLTVADSGGLSVRGGVQLIDHNREDKLTALPAESLLVDPLLLERAVRLAITGLKDSLPPIR